MKIAKPLVLLLALVPALGWAQTAADYVAQGRAFVAAHDLLNANKQFAAAVALAPNNPDANVLLAATRLLTLANQPAGEAFLNRLGFSATNRSIYAWTATVPKDTNGVPFAPAGVSAAEIADFVRTNCLPEILAADANLAAVTDTNYTLTLSSYETTTVNMTLDFGDLVLLRAGLQVAEYICYTVCSWNLDAQLTEVRSLWTKGATTVQEFLEQYPSLLTFATTNDLDAARQAFSGAVALYTNASAFIRNRPLSVIRLFNYDPTSAQDEAGFQTTLVELNNSLNGPVVLTWNSDKTGPMMSTWDTNVTVDLGHQFTAAFFPRAFFPGFFGNAIVAGTLPDSTFGGVLGGFAPYQIEAFLANRQHVPFVPHLRIPVRLPGNQFRVTVDGLENSFYAIQVSSNLLDWSNLSFGIVHQGALSFADPVADGGPQRFYRILDRSAAVGVDLTVIDAQTGSPVPAATVTLSVGSWEWNVGYVWRSDNAVTNSTDSAGHAVELLAPMGDSSYVVAVAAPGYANWTFDGYLPGDQHQTLSAALAPSGYQPPNDTFARRQTLTSTSLTATGCNAGATSEGGPYPGVGRAVWWTWTTPSDGAVIVDTSASSFNTVLGIYTGNAWGWGSVVSMASTDTPFGSQANFFVQAGVAYQICVDSSDGSSGRVVLNLYYTTPLPPAFTSQPVSQTLQVTVYDDDEADFSAAASGTAPISYQWQKNGTNIPGATDTAYSFGPPVQPSDAGTYTLVATNAVGSVTSAPAILSVIAPPPNYTFANATVIQGTNITVGGYNWSAMSDASGLELGIGQTVWWRWTAPADGAVIFDITGSSFESQSSFAVESSFEGVLGVFVGNSVTNLVPVYLETYPSGAVTLFVRAGVTYQIAVDSVGSQGGRIALNVRYTTPSAPVFVTEPLSSTNRPGDSIAFSAEVSGTAPMTYQWQKNGADVLGATNTFYSIRSVQTNDAGAYVLLAMNPAGTNPSTPAVLTVAGTAGPAGALLQEYLPLHVGDHYTELTESGTTNSVVVQAGVSKYPGSFSLTSTGFVSGTEYSTTGYVGYAGSSAVTYETDSGPTLTTVNTPPEVIMTEAALATLGTPFTGRTAYTNSFTEAAQTFETVTSYTISGVVSSTGTVSVIAGTFKNCLASEQTGTTITTSTILGIGTTNTNTFNETVIYAPNVGVIKVIGENGANIEELVGGVIGGVVWRQTGSPQATITPSAAVRPRQ